MKKTMFIMFLGMLSFNIIHAQKYFGKTYTPTENVDEYFDEGDIEKSYTIMGTTELGQGFRSLEKLQEKIIKLAKKKGADGVIFSMKEEVYGTSNSGSGVITSKDKKKDKKTTTVSSGGTTTQMKQKKVYATFIKYE